MKSASFTYHRPTGLDEALHLLAEYAEDDGRVLAGGQTLTPMMALRIAYPGHLIDINGIQELACTRVDGRVFVIRALARHKDFHKPVAPGPLGNLMAEVSRHIAHYPIRVRGTFCGSLANADPSSEWCLLSATLGATMVLQSKDQGQRRVPIDEYFLGPMVTAIEPDEMLVEVHLPLLLEDEHFGFYEFNRRAGDFALGSCLVTMRLKDGVIGDVRIGVGGIEEHPRRIAEAEAVLIGKQPSVALYREAADAAVQVVDALDDPQTPADYRRDLAGVVVRRALEAAYAPAV